MKKIIFTMLMSMAMVGAFAQLKVVSNGDILVKNTGLGTTTSNLDIPVHNSNRNNFQAGSFGIQSFADNNGFLTHNSYFDIAQGGNRVVMRTAGRGALAQFFDGRVIYRVVPNGAAGAPVAFTDALVIQNNANVQIGYPWTAPQASKLAVNGAVSATAFNMISDRRLKQNTTEFKYGLNEVLKLKPIYFQYNGKAGITDESTHIGLFAQDLREVVPELVNEFKYQEVDVINDLAGEVSETGKEETYYSIKDNEVKYLLINAIKDQQQLIEDKDARITELEEKLAALEDKVNDIVNQYDVNLGGGLSDAGLGQNIPNPFNGETQIAYNIPENAKSSQMNVYDMNGRLLKTISISHTGKGNLNLQASDIPAGTYSYQLVVDNQLIGTKKMVKSN